MLLLFRLLIELEDFWHEYTTLGCLPNIGLPVLIYPQSPKIRPQIRVYQIVMGFTRWRHRTERGGFDWIEQGLTSPPTQYRLSGRQFYRSKDPTNSIKVLKEKLASHRPEEAPNPPGASHRVTSEPLKKK